MTSHSKQKDSRPADWMEAGRLAELGLLAASLVHELKQPLFAVKAILQLAEAEANGAGLHSRLNILMEQVKNMEGIIHAYDGMAQRPRDSAETYHPITYIQTACSTLAHRAGRMGTTIELHVDPDLPVLNGSSLAFQQVLINLLQNALDATSNGSNPRIVLIARSVDGYLEISLNDNGSGVLPRDRERVFEPFFTTKPPGRGTGLGLAIARELVNKAGGSIEIASEGNGTQVLVRYPGAVQDTPGYLDATGNT